MAEDERWRDPAAYAFTDGLDDAGWAWEFLRRNPAFRAAAREAAGQPAARGTAMPTPLAAWGLLFRAGPGHASWYRPGDLAARLAA